MKFIPNAATVKFARTALKAKKHSPALMFGAGVVTAVASTVFACKATLEIDSVLNDMQEKKAKVQKGIELETEKYTEKQAAKDLLTIRVQGAVALGKLYAPSIGLGILSIGLLTGSHVVLSKRNVALTAAYSALEKGFNEYRGRVREELGEDKEREFRYGSIETEIVEEGEHGHEVKTVKRLNPRGTSIYAREFAEGNPNWQPMMEFNRMFLQAQQNHANDRLQAYGHIFLNDVYDMLKFPRTKAGQIVGWVANNGDNFVDFGLFDEHQQIRDFMRGEGPNSVWLDFNVDGPVLDLI